MEYWYTVIAALAAVYIPSALVLIWVFTKSSAYDPYEPKEGWKPKDEDEHDH